MWKFFPDLQEMRIGLLIVVVLLTACSGRSSSGAKEETPVLGNYSDLYQYNAYLLDGYIVR